MQQKMLVLLLAGIAIGSTRSNRKHWKIAKAVYTEFSGVHDTSVNRAMHSLYNAELIYRKIQKDGTEAFVLTNVGKKYALEFNIDNIVLPKKKRWDGKWRIVMYDIPRKLNKVRQALQHHFKQIGLKELQKSVFVYPYDCHKEIKYIIEFYGAWKYAEYIVAESISNERKFERLFDLK